MLYFFWVWRSFEFICLKLLVSLLIWFFCDFKDCIFLFKVFNLILFLWMILFIFCIFCLIFFVCCVYLFVIFIFFLGLGDGCFLGVFGVLGGGFFGEMVFLWDWEIMLGLWDFDNVFLWDFGNCFLILFFSGSLFLYIDLVKFSYFFVIFMVL